LELQLRQCESRDSIFHAKSGYNTSVWENRRKASTTGTMVNITEKIKEYANSLPVDWLHANQDTF